MDNTNEQAGRYRIYVRVMWALAGLLAFSGIPFVFLGRTYNNAYLVILLLLVCMWICIAIAVHFQRKAKSLKEESLSTGLKTKGAEI